LLEKLAKISGDKVGKGGIGSIFGNVFKWVRSSELGAGSKLS
jgi:hypothetical protein